MMETAYLYETIISQLYPYQINRIESMIKDYIKINHAAAEFTIDVCPKCRMTHPRLIKGGLTVKGKQMMRCTHCNKRFVIDYGQPTFYSHQDQSKWNDLIIDTEEGVSLKRTAAKMNLHEMTIFRMRHKYLRFLEEIEKKYILKNQIEMDEKYFVRSHKGTRKADLKSKNRGGSSLKRGLSNEQVCVLTAAERNGKAAAQAYNMAKPKSEDILNMEKHIHERRYVWIDGLTSYHELLNRLHCNMKEVKDRKQYDAVNHLNNVSSFHSRIERAYSS